MTILFFFISGLIIGSFLNVVVYRLNVAESILGRSHCPHCKKQIRWYDNIPLFSFILLRMKCRDCNEKISWQYPLMEFVTGAVFALLGNYFFFLSDPQSWIITAYFLALFSLLLVIFMYDLKYMEIPMIIFWIALGVSLLYAIFSDWLNFIPELGIWNLSIFSGMIGGVIAFLFFFILVLVSKEKWMGMGDAYLAFLAGFVVGYPKIFFTLAAAFLIGSICSIILLLAKKKTMKSQIPFAPFLVSAMILAIFLSKIFPGIDYYYSMFY
ncbi:MAG: prepilin peptidase [Parcubacteria group bacterium]|jgi:leader peptidase (prepilin peptidase)/N-methyltransferase